MSKFKPFLAHGFRTILVTRESLAQYQNIFCGFCRVASFEPVLKYRILLFAILLLAPLFVSTLSEAHANYRLNSTASDTWPATYGGGTALVTSVKVGMANGPNNQIITGGSYGNGTNGAQLRIYHKNGNSLVLDKSQQWPLPGVYSYTISGIEVADLAGTGQNNTIFTANIQPLQNQPPTNSQIGIYRWTGASLVRQYVKNFTGPSNVIETRSLAIWSYAGVRQIVTLGYYATGGINYAQLGIWSWDGSTFTKNSLWNWTTTGAGATGSQGFSVSTGDVEGIGIPDIVTVGSSNNGTLTQSEIRVWGWTGSGNPLLKQSRQWISSGQASAASSATIRDLKGDGKREIVVGGQLLAFPFWRAELTVWSDWSSSLTQLAQTDWITSSQTISELIKVSAGDIDNSGAVEIVTASWANMPVGANDVFYGIVRAWTWNGSTISLQKVFQYSTAQTILVGLTVADIDRVGKQDVVVGGAQTWKGFLDVRDVSMVSSSVTTNVVPSTGVTGQSVTVSGSLTNTTDSSPLALGQVLLEYSTNGGSYQIIGTVTTDSQGRYSTSFTPPSTGSYSVRTTWNGDETHNGASSTTTLTINKAPSVIVLSSSSSNIQPGDAITVTGYVYPATSTPVTVTYTGPAGTVSHNVTSTSTGSFTDQYAPNTSGSWTIAASWGGSSNTANSSSNNLSLQVQQQPLGVTLSLYGFAIAIGALGLGLAAYLVGRKSLKRPGSSQGFRGNPASSGPAATN